MEVIKLKFTLDLVKNCDQYETPFFLFDPQIIKDNFKKICSYFNKAKVFYAVKANPHPKIIKILKEVGASFEVASKNELKQLIDLGISVDKIIYSAPVKPWEHIQFAFQKGIRVFVFDSEDEINKLSKYAPGSKVFLRIAVEDKGSEFPLSEKFGADPEMSYLLLLKAKEQGLSPYGIVFHVGSQCLNIYNWEKAIRISNIIFKGASRIGIQLKVLNLGGGIPVRYLNKVPKVSEIAQKVNKLIAELFHSDIDIWTEPGRAIVGDAAVLVASVIGKVKRGQNRWLYLDVGAFNGLMETIEKREGFDYEIRVTRKGLEVKYIITGPTCDSFDTMFRDIFLPEIETGDRVYIMNTGAYTLAYASSFNGFPPPAVYFLSKEG